MYFVYTICMDSDIQDSWTHFPFCGGTENEIVLSLLVGELGCLLPTTPLPVKYA